MHMEGVCLQADTCVHTVIETSLINTGLQIDMESTVIE